jgi:DNA-binding response OmpR family regulator
MKVNLLIAVPEVAEQEWLASLLPTDRFDVMTACTGEQALEIAVQKRPDMMIVSVELPDMSGIEVLCTVRRNQAIRSMAVMLIADHAPNEVLFSAFRCHSDAFWTRPFPAEQFTNFMDRIFSSGPDDRDRFQDFHPWDD